VFPVRIEGRREKSKRVGLSLDREGGSRAKRPCYFRCEVEDRGKKKAFRGRERGWKKKGGGQGSIEGLNSLVETSFDSTAVPK